MLSLWSVFALVLEPPFAVFIRDLLISHEISCGPPSTVLRDKKVLKSVGSLSVCVRALPAQASHGPWSSACARSNRDLTLETLVLERLCWLSL